MKQAATILLISILAFNWLGYRLLSGYLEHRSDVAIESRIEAEDYNEANLLELRVPMNAPYLSSSTEFERVDGEIEINGILYKYVKRKIDNGELVLMCIPHAAKTKILNSRADFFKLVNDLNQTNDGKTKHSTTYKSVTTEYSSEANYWNIEPLTVVNDKQIAFCLSLTQDGFNLIPEQPPQV